MLTNKLNFNRNRLTRMYYHVRNAFKFDSIDAHEFNNGLNLRCLTFYKLDTSPCIIVSSDYNIAIYQSPLILTELFQHNPINVSYLTACYLYQVMMALYFLNDVANDAETNTDIKNYVIIASLKSVQQWIN